MSAARPFPPARRLALPLGALAVCAATGCAVKPGYVDSTTGRAYAGYAKPACLPGDLCGLCGVKECDCRRDPYTPPAAAFTSFPGLHAAACRRGPGFVSTHVHAPMPARYEQFAGHANRTGGPNSTGRSPRPPGGADAPPAPMPADPLAAPMPRPLDSPAGPGLPEADADGLGR